MFSAKNYDIVTGEKVKKNTLRILSLDEVNTSLADEFLKRKKEKGLKFFSQYYFDSEKDIKYYVTSNPNWTEYYLKNSLIEYDHLYEEGMKIDTYLAQNNIHNYTQSFYWHSIGMTSKEQKEVNGERLIQAQHDHGVGVVQKFNNLVIATVLSGDLKDQEFYKKLTPGDFGTMGNLSRKSILSI
jgi:hypothetical protein